jgi:hypothetical protein
MRQAAVASFDQPTTDAANSGVMRNRCAARPAKAAAKRFAKATSFG